jgi:hypothetical protein
MPATPPSVPGAIAVTVAPAGSAVILGNAQTFTATVTNTNDTGVARSVNDVGHSYTVYAEPLDGVVAPAQISPAIVSLCRNSTTDAGWPPLQACVVPAVDLCSAISGRS